MAAKSAVGQSFSPSEDGTMTRMRFYIRRYGNPVGHLQVYLYNSTTLSGRYIPDDDPVNSGILVRSSIVDMADVSTTYHWETFTFDYDIVSATHYIAQLVITDATTLDATNRIHVWGWTTSTDCTGDESTYDADNEWKGYAYDVCMEVYAGDTILYNCDETGAAGYDIMQAVHPSLLSPSQRALKFMPIHGWESGEEEYLKGEISSTGVLSTS